MGVTYNPKIVTNGLVLALDAANVKSYPGSGTAWTDMSGLGNNGALTNGPTFSSNNAGSIVFDGTNDYINFSTYSQPEYLTTTSFTWGIWVKTSVNSVNPIMGNRVGSSWVKITTANFEYSPTNLSGNVPLNLWSYVNAVKDTTNLRYYINASLIGSSTSSTTKASQVFYLGGDPSANELSQCSISVAHVYNRALSATEIQQNFNALRGRYGI